MASYYIFSYINQCRLIFLVWKAKLVFGLLKWYNLTRYQPQFTKPKLTDQLYQTKSTESNFSYGIKPNLFNQLYQIKSTKPNLKNQIYLAKCLISWLNKFDLIPKGKSDLVDLVWYNWSVNCGSVNWGWYLVRLYHLSKPKTNFAFHTIKVRPALVDISLKIW